MELGIYSFGDRRPDPGTGVQVSVADTMQMDWSGVPHKDVMAAIELLGTEVLPVVREEFSG
jgi:hypothetical protein